MRKIFVAVILVLCLCSSSFASLVEQDIELHKVIGGLYSLAAAVEINQKTNPDPRQLRNYFDDLPNDWLDKIRVSRKANSIWVGVLIDQQSSARNYLRVNAPDLKITSDPEGYDWLGGYYAWIKAADVVNDKLHPMNLIAVKSDGALFFSTKDQQNWWQANPSFNFRAEKMVLNKFTTNNAPELSKPKGVSNSVYERVKPKDTSKKPDEIHLKRKKSFTDEMSIEMGDVIFNPIPNTK